MNYSNQNKKITLILSLIFKINFLNFIVTNEKKIIAATEYWKFMASLYNSKKNKPINIAGRQTKKNKYFVLELNFILSFFLFNLKQIRLSKLVIIEIGSNKLKILIIS